MISILQNSSLLWIVFFIAFSGLCSISIAAFFSFSLLSRLINQMVSLSVGFMLATTFLHVLPEAFDAVAADHLLMTFLGGVLGFFVLEKMAILRHSHHYEGDGHDHGHGHDQQAAGRSGWIVLLGDGLHNFTDGILIAAAFLADFHLGVVTSLAIIAHEIPQEIGDFIVLLNAGFSRKRAFFYNILSSFMAIFGGLAGYFFLESASSWVPYVLVVASSGMVYIAVSDLMPRMHLTQAWKDSGIQIFLIALGVAIVYAMLPEHDHHHSHQVQTQASPVHSHDH